MNLEKYKNDGWGLSELALKKIIEIIDKIDNTTIRIIEFGSGKSTEFFADLDSVHKKDLIITSFDNDPKYAYKKKEGDGVTLNMRGLVECSDDEYNKMFEKKEYNTSVMYTKKTPLNFRQKNNFYDIKEGDLYGEYDLMVLDGPNGNGRNISFLHMKEHLRAGSYVLIDDFTHYDFVEKFLHIFNAKEVFKNKTGKFNQWDNGGDFVIYKIM